MFWGYMFGLLLFSVSCFALNSTHKEIIGKMNEILKELRDLNNQRK